MREREREGDIRALQRDRHAGRDNRPRNRNSNKNRNS